MIDNCTLQFFNGYVEKIMGDPSNTGQSAFFMIPDFRIFTGKPICSSQTFSSLVLTSDCQVLFCLQATVGKIIKRIFNIPFQI